MRAIVVFCVLVALLPCRTHSHPVYRIGDLAAPHDATGTGPWVAQVVRLAVRHINELSAPGSNLSRHGLQAPLNFSLQLVEKDCQHLPVPATAACLEFALGTNSSNNTLSGSGATSAVLAGLCDGESSCHTHLDFGTENSSSVVALIGPAYSSVALPSSFVNTVMATPQISYSASAPELSDKTKYPFFCRNIPSDTKQVLAVLKLLQRLGLSHISVVHQGEPYSSGFAVVLSNEATNYDITVHTVQRFGKKGEHLDAAMAALARTRTSVIVGIFLSDVAPRVLLSAHQHHLTSEFGVSWFGTDGWFGADKWHLEHPEALLLSSILVGMVGSAPLDVSGTAAFRAVFNETAQNLPFAYDAVWSVAHAINMVVQEKGDPHNGTMLHSALQRIDFAGMVGRVHLGASCEGTVDYTLFNYQRVDANDNVMGVAVGMFDKDSLALNMQKPIVWSWEGTTDTPNGALLRPLHKTEVMQTIVVGVVCGMLFVFTVVQQILVFSYRTDRRIMSQGYWMLHSILLGTHMLVGAVPVRVVGTSQDQVCSGAGALFSSGSVVIAATLALRAHRLKGIFKATILKEEKKLVKDGTVAVVLLALLVYQFAVAFFLPGTEYVRETHLTIAEEDVYVCKTVGVWDWILPLLTYLPTVAAMIFAVGISYDIRNIPFDFNASKATGMAVYASVTVSAILALFSTVLQRSPTMATWGLLFCVVLYVPTVQGLLVLQALIHIHSGALETAAVKGPVCRNCGSRDILKRRSHLRRRSLGSSPAELSSASQSSRTLPGQTFSPPRRVKTSPLADASVASMSAMGFNVEQAPAPPALLVKPSSTTPVLDRPGVDDELQ